MGRSVCDELSCKQNDQINYDFSFVCRVSSPTVLYEAVLGATTATHKTV